VTEHHIYSGSWN